MKKQVKVDVSWNGDSVSLKTNRGMEYVFVIGNHLSARCSCETIVASHIASLIVPTVASFFKASNDLRFRFVFTAYDGIEL